MIRPFILRLLVDTGCHGARFRRCRELAYGAVSTKLGRVFVLTLGMSALSTSNPAMAHHGSAGLFDEERTVELTGVVREWSFVNPHPVMLLEVASDSGELQIWDIYFGPAAATIMRRRGYSEETFVLGETVTVTGHPATSEGVLGMDVWGTGTGVFRSDGAQVP